MKIFILGTGHMGSWFVEELCLDHEVAIFDPDKKKMKYFFNVKRLYELEELKGFSPELLLNATPLQITAECFDKVLPLIPESTILADITSVKAGISDYYKKLGRPFVSSHPMFGPTFANVRDLRDENVIIIKESDQKGKEFFTDFYKRLNLNIHEYTFEEHDETIAYSLSIPFASSIVFAACMKEQEAPGTTFKKHHDIAKKLLSEDDYLLSEIMLNPHTLAQIEKINSQLSYLTHIIKGRDFEEMQKLLGKLRKNIN